METRTTTPSLRRTRKRGLACRRCHSYKIRCSGTNPCDNCEKASKRVECTYPKKDRKVLVSESYLNDLKDEVNTLKRSNGNNSSAVSENLQVSLEPASIEQNVQNPLVSNQPELVQRSNLARPVYLGDASGIVFGMKIRQLLQVPGTSTVTPARHHYFHDPKLLRINNHSSEFSLPEKSYALLLVRLVKRFFGETHYLNLGSHFAERLLRFYDSQVEDQLWICRLFFVFALGELCSNQTSKSSTPQQLPGVSFYLSAIGLLEDAYEEASVLFVETLILASLFSDAVNRTSSAYAYIGLALRVSLTLGLHRNSHQTSAMDREHRVRVWWTVYYLERLSSSKLGHPMMLRDEDISTALPSFDGLSESEKAEFPSANILIAQIELAKIVAMIAKDLYLVAELPRPFLQSVQNIFISLKRWHERLPTDLAWTSNNTSRAYASLHLLYNQCVTLATRPVLLLVFQEHLKTVQAAEAGLNPTRTGMPEVATLLAKHCIQGARNINKILTDLWVEGSLIMLGFTDALLLYTSTMALLISDALPSGSPQDKDGIESACRLIESMRDHGNIAAVEFAEQISLIRQDLSRWTKRGQAENASRPPPDGRPGGYSRHEHDFTHNLATADTIPQHLGVGLNTIDQESGHHQPYHNISNTEAPWPSFGANPLQPSFYLQADSVGLNPIWSDEASDPAITQHSVSSDIGSGSVLGEIQPFQAGNAPPVGNQALDLTDWVGNEMEYLVSLADMEESNASAFTFLWE